jgi:hypothetical protein
VEDLKSRTTPAAIFGDRVVAGFNPSDYEDALSALDGWGGKDA